MNNNQNPFYELDYNTYPFDENVDINKQYPVNEDIYDKGYMNNDMQYPYDEDIVYDLYPNGNDMYNYPLNNHMGNMYPDYPDYSDLYGRFPNNMEQYPMINYPGYPMEDLMKRNSCYCVKSYLRLLNALVDGPALDVYVNEVQIASNLKFGEFSRHVLYSPGDYQLTAYKAGTINTPILKTDIIIYNNLTYTGVIAGEISDPAEISVFMIPEEKENADMNIMTALRLINLGVNTPSLDLVLDDETKLIYGLNYGDASNNIAIPAGHYTLHLRKTDDTIDILSAANVDLAPKMHYTLFIIGRYGDSPRIELIIPDDGVNYLDIC